MEVLQLKEVTKEFGKRMVLDKVSFSIEEGDVFGIVGQSGSGKTTLLNMMIGFYEPSEGKVLFQIKENKKPRKVHNNLGMIRRKFGFSSQTSSFYPKLTVKENLIHFGRLYGIKTKVLRNNIISLLDFTELRTHHNQLAGHISVGMQKRLDLSCALINKPKVLILDEPTAELDPILQKEIVCLIQQANQQGITVVVASHSLNDIEQVCNKVALIHEGKLIACGKVEEMKRRGQQEGAIYLKAGEHHQGILEQAKHFPLNRIIDRGDSLVLYTSDIQKTLYHLIGLTQKENIILEELDIKKPSLQEIFEKMIKAERERESK